MQVAGMLAGVALALSTCTGCGADDSDIAATETDPRFGDDAGVPQDTSNPDPPPEQEREFEFSQPATVGESIFVANRTLNSVAVIDTTSLSITTIPVGFRPSMVVGPDRKYADQDSARAVVLNQGDSTATLINPTSLEASAHNVLDQSNSVAMDPTGQRALFWYDDDKHEGSGPAGDLSSLSVLKTDGPDANVYRVAVGFHIRKIFFSDDGSTALVWSDDGVSRIDLSTLDSDTLSPPVPLMPPDVSGQIETPDDLFATADGRYVAARLPSINAIVVLDTEDKERHLVEFPTKPTDLDLFRAPQPAAWVMLPAEDKAAKLTIPDGIENAADLEDSQPVPPLADTGTGSDAGDTSDAGTMADVSSSPDTGTSGSELASVDGVSVYDISVPGLGAASMIDADQSNSAVGLLFTTTGDEKRVVIIDLKEGSQKRVALQKQVRGATPAPASGSFVIYNQKQPGAVPDDATPGDPEYVARSWGVTALDAKTGATRLLLTSYEPGPATLWAPTSGNQGDPTVYVAFEPPPSNQQPGIDYSPARRDVIGLNLSTFRHRTYRMPTIPVGIGAIGSQKTVYVDQRHPQGRMTFIEVGTDSTRTVTGYQLNSRIQ